MAVLRAAAVSCSLCLPSLCFPLLLCQHYPRLSCCPRVPRSMGCSNSSSAGGCKGPEKETSEDTISQDEKHRNYGGVYVGLPIDASTTCRDPKEAEAPSKSKALNTMPGSPLPENVC
ncbi:overexpressed in colon carcinoma 1 protein [Engystomops pustulosus]|uniref:overexpressed in colon carcinoma 1 protein n=1 Tax=Engystomops pustulosus TaxID=76066 RepID=UPI003AFA5A1C